MNTTIRNEDEKINIDRLIHRGVALAPACSYHTGGQADYLAAPVSLHELRAAIEWAGQENLPITILGGGSNVLVSDDGVEGLVVLTTGLTAHHVRGAIFCTQCGLSLDTAINVSIEHSLSDLEPLGGLPGTVGGAVWGNAGAGSLWISELIEWIDYLDYEGKLWRYHRSDGEFSYKKSPFIGTGSIIYEVAFRLTPNKSTSEARLQKERSRAERIQTGQFDLPSAGCVFKNPKGDSAGRLIDEAGLKGRTLGGAMISPDHANFIVNKTRGASSRDIFELSRIVEEEVFSRYNVRLEREITLIGRW